MFLCGTLAEIEPALSVDRYAVGDGEVGPVTRALADWFRRVVRGQEARYRGWLEPIKAATPEAQR
ncbi:MAG: hypothetical protein NTZ05_15530 [Chloroflexi bacterium]|nr:hypothetical protein [Chloroflexota bacterium]